MLKGELQNPFQRVQVMLKNGFFRTEVGSEFLKEKIESIIEIPDAFTGSFANIDVLRIQGLCIFLFTPSYSESLF